MWCVVNLSMQHMLLPVSKESAHILYRMLAALEFDVRASLCKGEEVQG